MAVEDASGLIEGFKLAGQRIGLLGSDFEIKHELLSAPHRPPSALPIGYAAAYVFSISAASGAACPAGANRTLKVGMVGPKSSARFTSQHYLPGSSGSNLAKSLVGEAILWAYLGIEHLDTSTVKSWMLANLERDHFFVRGAEARIERELERYLRGHLGPVFEG